MPQMNKGGKFIFGKSLIRDNDVLMLPTQTIEEYDITAEGESILTKEVMAFLKISPGMKLLSIRSSDIVFTMGAMGLLVEEAKNLEEVIPLF